MLIVMDADATRDPQLLKGVLPMLVLALLHQQESYGYELVTRLRSHGLDSIAPGTVYPVLTRLEREGRLTSYLMASSAGPARKYYRPTPARSEERREGKGGDPAGRRTIERNAGNLGEKVASRRYEVVR